MSDNVDVSKLRAYAGTYQKSLITKLTNGLQVTTDCTLVPNVKVQVNSTKLIVEGTVKPYDGVRDKLAKITYEPRALNVYIGQYDVDIDPIKFRETWLGEVMKPGVNPQDIPFESFTWDAVMADFASQINDNTAWAGRRDSTVKTAAGLATGFGNIIKDEIGNLKITPVVTGSMLSDTVNKVEKVYKSLPTKYRRQKMVVYCSYNTYDAYNTDFAERFKMSPIYNQFNQLVIRGTEGNCILKPVTWMAGSGRIIITTQNNMKVGTDLLSDAQKINTVPMLYGVQAGILMAIGFQIEDLEPLAVNDQE